MAADAFLKCEYATFYLVHNEVNKDYLGTLFFMVFPWY